MLIRMGTRHLIQKAQPNQTDVYVNAPLSNMTIGWQQKTTLYVADQIFPQIAVQQQSGLYFKWSRADLLRDEAMPRADSTESVGGGFSLTTAPYSVVPYAYHKMIGDQLRANASSVLQLDQQAMNHVMTKIWISKEKQFLNTVFKTGVWATDKSPGSGMGTQWGAADSTPREDIDAAKQLIKNISGQDPNILLISDAVFYALRSNAEIHEQIKYTNGGAIDEDIIAKFFGVQKIMRAGAVINTAKEGLAENTVPMAGKHALLLYTPDAPGIGVPAAGYTLVWQSYLGQTTGVPIRKYRIDLKRADRIEGEQAFAQVITAPELGVFFNGVVT